ncbi:MAG: glutathione peroxidase [Bifidobacteriaceae bacterium]|jgi:glutathione peroxidase|nr:glutathione peroxidase [Bifidobacteriaceae bacterium]
MNLYDIVVKNAHGEDVSLREYSGKVLLIVNTATHCGFTPQYEGLQELYEKYVDEGFEVLDFPCNQFGHQAPESDAEIVQFCSINFAVAFPQFAKIDVNGKDESPLYTHLKSAKSGVFGDKIKWNFTKFLVNRNGEVVARYASATKPETLVKEIEILLKEQK